jgi:hypothetical protein
MLLSFLPEQPGAKDAKMTWSFDDLVGMDEQGRRERKPECAVSFEVEVADSVGTPPGAPGLARRPKTALNRIVEQRVPESLRAHNRLSNGGGERANRSSVRRCLAVSVCPLRFVTTGKCPLIPLRVVGVVSPRKPLKWQISDSPVAPATAFGSVFVTPFRPAP